MDQEMTFSLSYEQLTRFAEQRIRECKLDSEGGLHDCIDRGRHRSGLLV